MSWARLKIVARFGVNELAERPTAAERLDLAALVVALVDPELSDLEARALVDDDRDVDALAIGGQHHPRRADLDAQVPLVVVERAQHQDVALEDVLPVGPAGPERQEAAVARLHLVAQIGVGHVLVADEGDAPHRHRLVLDDLELDDDLVLARVHDLVGDVGEEEALLGVGVLDLLHAAAHGRHAQDRVRLDLDRLVELVVLDLVVAREGDLLDVGSLSHDEAEHDAPVVGGQIDLDVLEEPRVPQGVHVGREVLDLEEVARLLAQVGEDVVAGDAAVADDLDGDDRQALGLLGGGLRERDGGLRSAGRGAGGATGGRSGGPGIGAGRSAIGGGAAPSPGRRRRSMPAPRRSERGQGCPHRRRRPSPSARRGAPEALRPGRRASERFASGSRARDLRRAARKSAFARSARLRLRSTGRMYERSGTTGTRRGRRPPARRTWRPASGRDRRPDR